ncbi:crotonase/enoyl-CoA hydratase family protein [Ectothiorhodospiraceae bacterium WFHF3C12]|nr:crotonase/enoyl-CoA hydratase family protein [Ectothiorhodospiraceae bacterium WFHF3C12]
MIFVQARSANSPFEPGLKAQHDPPDGPTTAGNVNTWEEGTVSSPINCEIQGDLAILTLNRPEKLNALNYALLDRFLELLDELEADDAVRALVVTGAGERAFSAGADIAEFADSVHRGVGVALREFCRRGQNVTRRLEDYPKPIIAAVNGLAWGGGCEITEAMALTVAAENAQFCKSEIRLGLIPDFGGTQRLPRIVGRKRALEMILSGEPVSAKRAHELCLVNRLAPVGEAVTVALEMAREITRYSAVAVEAALTSVNRGINVSIDEGLAMERAQFARTAATEDIREGISAFLDRRPAHFTGR